MWRSRDISGETFGSQLGLEEWSTQVARRCWSEGAAEVAVKRNKVGSAQKPCKPDCSVGFTVPSFSRLPVACQYPWSRGGEPFRAFSDMNSLLLHTCYRFAITAVA